MHQKKQKGFTVVELVIALVGIALLVFVIGLVITGIHFIAKAW